MNCPNCNTPIDSQIAFCPNCGQRIIKTQDVTNTVQDSVDALQKQPERKWKGFFIAGIILLVLGAITVWVPIVGVILCVLSLVFANAAKNRTENKTKGVKFCVVMSIVATVIAAFVTFIIIATIIFAPKITDSAKEFALEKIKDQFGSYNEYTGYSLDAKETADDYIITGTVKYEISDYFDKKIEVYEISVDCKVKRDPTSGKFTMIENKSTKALKETKALPSASSKINEKKALKFAEEEFIKRVRFKNESSYVRNDYSVTSSYNLNGSISVTVLLDFSAQNSFGGMTRSLYKITLQYSNGEYTFVDYLKIS